ncbi:MAG: WecB/TagA/CpsF family glycosyltransferase [Pseudomonadota bacterium]
MINKPTATTKEVSDEFGTGAPLPRAEIGLRQDDLDRDVACILGTPIDYAAIDSAVTAVERSVRDRRRLSFVTPNVNWLVRAYRDETARQEIINADLSLVDGAPLAALAKALGAPVQGRVAGSDLFEALRRRPPFSRPAIRVFFFGGREGAAAAAAEAIEREDSSLRSAGFLNPGFGDIDEMSRPEIIDEINASDSDFIVVALGAAKGQAWIERNRDKLNAPVTAHLGAVVDFTAGSIVRAPSFVQRLGLEWAWRIKEEPSLWRRYGADAVSLAEIAWRRAAPAYLALKMQKRRGLGVIETRDNGDIAEIILKGDFERAGLAAFRAEARAALARGRSLRLNLAEVGHIDVSFLGTLMMVRKILQQKGLNLYLSGVSTVHRRLLTASGFSVAQDAADKNAENAETPLAAAS